MHLVLRATMNDTHTFELRSDMGVTATPLPNSTALASVASSLATAVVGDTSGISHLAVDWSSSAACGGGGVFAGVLPIGVRIAVPVDIVITVGTTRLTPQGNPAVKLAVPFSTSIQVQLVYADGTRVDATSQDRTQYNLVGPSGMLVISKANARVSTSGTAPTLCGNVLLSIGLNGMDAGVTQGFANNHVVFTVVCLVDVHVISSPYPTYLASGGVEETTLSKIGASGVYQRSVLRAFALFSDNQPGGSLSTTNDISGTASLRYDVYATGTTTPSTVVAVDALTGIVSPARAGLVHLVARFDDVISTHPVEITVEDTPLGTQQVCAGVNVAPCCGRLVHAELLLWVGLCSS